MYPVKDSTPLILSKLGEIASAVMYAVDAGKIEHVLERIAQVSAELVNAKYAALGVPNNRGGLRYFKVAGMTMEEIAQLDHLPRGHGLIGAIMHDRKTIRLSRMQDDSRSIGFPRAHPPMSSLLGVPIQIGHQLFGTLYLCDKTTGEPFTEMDEWLIETLAGYAALAIAGAEFRDREKRVALLEERERIGMELHDGIIQSLYAIGMQLDLMRMTEKATYDEMGDIIGHLNEVIEDIRRYIQGLHNRGQQKSIRECLNDMVNRLHPPETMRIVVTAPDDQPPFTPAAFEAICQMSNEALSNAIRHADAQLIRVSVELINTEFRIIIEDDGRGFDMDTISSHSGLGLRNLRQRASLHHGSVEIDTEPGHGTRVTLSIPTRLI